MKMVKVFNAGVRPIVWERHPIRGVSVIHPGKSDLFSEVKAKEILDKFTDAVTEKEFKALKEPKEVKKKK